MTISKSSCKSLLSFAFHKQCTVDEQDPVYIDAQNRDINLNPLQTQTLTRRIIAGFLSNGLQKGDTVLVILANNVNEDVCQLAQV